MGLATVEFKQTNLICHGVTFPVCHRPGGVGRFVPAKPSSRKAETRKPFTAAAAAAAFTLYYQWETSKFPKSTAIAASTLISLAAATVYVQNTLQLLRLQWRFLRSSLKQSVPHSQACCISTSKPSRPSLESNDIRIFH